MTPPLLGVNIDHIATLRNARGVGYPCPIQAALLCEEAGADGITLHLREDRRHIKDADVYTLKKVIQTRMNLEMAATDEMLVIAADVRPQWVCLVPEKRAEVTTEGGLDVINNEKLPEFIKNLQASGIQVSLFIDPDVSQIARSIELGADAIEIHTGAYAEYWLNNNEHLTNAEIGRISDAVSFAKNHAPALIVNAGHGLTLQNVAPIAALGCIHELNIGHAIMSDAIFVGLTHAVKNMKQAIINGYNKLSEI